MGLLNTRNSSRLSGSVRTKSSRRLEATINGIIKGSCTTDMLCKSTCLTSYCMQIPKLSITKPRYSKACRSRKSLWSQLLISESLRMTLHKVTVFSWKSSSHLSCYNNVFSKSICIFFLLTKMKQTPLYSIYVLNLCMCTIIINVIKLITEDICLTSVCYGEIFDFLNFFLIYFLKNPVNGYLCFSFSCSFLSSFTFSLWNARWLSIWPWFLQLCCNSVKL